MEINNNFRNAPWFSESNPEKVLVGGCGGIGSWTTYFLASSGLDVFVVDNDIVEPHNLGGQMFDINQVGKLKVDAINDKIINSTGRAIAVINGRIELGGVSNYISVGAFDNMKARKDFFYNWKNKLSTFTVEPILIDGRLTLEEWQIFCVNRNTMDEYEEKYLFSDDEVAPLQCSMKQTTFSAAMIGSHICGMVLNHVTNIITRDEIRFNPFLWEYNNAISNNNMIWR